MVLVGEVEPAVSEPRDELADADIISSGGDGDFGAFWAGAIRSRWTRMAAIPVLAGAVAAAALAIPRAHPAARLTPPGQHVAITNTTTGLGSGAFAAGTAGGRAWQLTVQDIADPGLRCLPGVSVNGNDPEPLFADPPPLPPTPPPPPPSPTLASSP